MYIKQNTYSYEKQTTVSVKIHKYNKYNRVNGKVSKNKKWLIVNQKGQIQPIGGVNEKIEGYFQICKMRGLTGEHGVMIPVQNGDNLQLSDEIVSAVKKGLFHVYAVSTIEEGIEVLTGVPAGKKDKNGRFPAGTVNYLVYEKLKKYAKIDENK